MNKQILEEKDVRTLHNKKLYTQFKNDNPETIGEKDGHFDDRNYIEWLEKKILSDERLSKAVDKAGLIKETANIIDREWHNMESFESISETIVNHILSTVAPVEDKWISVEDRLPEKMDYYWVNVANETELYQTKAIYSKNHGGWVTDVGTLFEDITDWMPLPQPPTPHNPSKEGE